MNSFQVGASIRKRHGYELLGQDDPFHVKSDVPTVLVVILQTKLEEFTADQVQCAGYRSKGLGSKALSHGCDEGDCCDRQAEDMSN